MNARGPRSDSRRRCRTRRPGPAAVEVALRSPRRQAAAWSGGRSRRSLSTSRPVPREAPGGVQLMGPPGQAQELIRRVRRDRPACGTGRRRRPGSGRLPERSGPDAGGSPRGPSRGRGGARGQDRPGRAAVERPPGRSGLDRPLVDLWGLDVDREAGALEELPPRRARRGEEQGLGTDPDRSAS